MIERTIKIEPLASLEHRPGAISYGVTSYGYERPRRSPLQGVHQRLGQHSRSQALRTEVVLDVEGDYCITRRTASPGGNRGIPQIPRDILCVCLGRARMHGVVLS